MMILWMVVIFGVMYFLMIRPQKKEQKRLQAMLNSMGQKVDIPLNAVRNLSQEEQKVLVDSMYTPIDDAQAEEIMNS